MTDLSRNKLHNDRYNPYFLQDENTVLQHFYLLRNQDDEEILASVYERKHFYRGNAF